MKNLLIKVCGLRDSTNIQDISALGVDMLGFIFYAKSPRLMEEKTGPAEFINLNLSQNKVGVFVNETVEVILAKATTYHLNAIQLHGKEGPQICRSLQSGFQVLKAFPIAEAADFEQTKNYEGVCDYFLFDAKRPSHGGNGFAFDWGVLDAYSGETPFFLSGGISPEDVSKIKAIEHPKLAGLDLNSRFETCPGMKNVAALQRFINLIM